MIPLASDVRGVQQHTCRMRLASITRTQGGCEAGVCGGGAFRLHASYCCDVGERNGRRKGIPIYLLVPSMDAWPLATPLPTKPPGRKAPAVASPAANTPTAAVLMFRERRRGERLKPAGFCRHVAGWGWWIRKGPRGAGQNC